MSILSKEQIRYIKNPEKYRKMKTDDAVNHMKHRIRKKITDTTKELLFILQLLSNDKFSNEVTKNLLNEEFLKELIFQFFKGRETAPDLKLIAELAREMQHGVNSNKKCKETWSINLNANIISKGNVRPLREW
jgi:hypothetical protein